MLIIGKFKDLTGQRFGRLTVIERAENKKDRVMWKCKCDCGNEHIVRGNSLVTGRCKSCGCLQRELNLKTKEKTNSYDLAGDYGIGYTYKGQIFKFDLEDYEIIKDYSWHINSNDYVVTNIYENGKQKKVSMHRMILHITDSKIFVDHINHDKADNRKSQLRVTNSQQNQFNHIIKGNNTSGETGVYWHKNRNKWEALIGYNEKIIYLGMFDNKKDAINARKEAEIKYYGEYRYCS